jgi:5-methylcytosine-specific restriction endonuclease McrA
MAFGGVIVPVEVSSMNPYRSSEWNAFRSQVICLDNDCCVRCGRGEPDRVVFHVHHKTYLPGKLPWQYPFELCETLCAGCHAEHHGKFLPNPDGT